MRERLLALMIPGFLAIPAAAQEPQETDTVRPAPCADNPRFRDFDFWLGKWRVTDNASGNLAGHNEIVAEESGCVLVETWRGHKGSTGQSMNFFNPLMNEWRQLWVSGSSGGYAIDIAGGLSPAGAMVLEGEIFYFGAGNRFAFRGTWTPLDDGAVRQFFEQFDPESQAWNSWFDGRYARMEDN